MDLSLGPLSKLEFMQWKDVDRPTFTRICKSAINWLDYGNSLSGIDRYDMKCYFNVCWKADMSQLNLHETMSKMTACVI